MTPKLISLMLLCSPTLLWGKSALGLNYRADLREKLGSTICSKNAALAPQDIWRKGIYDAQSNGELVRSVGKPLEISELKRSLIEQAKQHRHFGGSFGACNKNDGWILSTPAPSPILKDGMDTYSITRRDLVQYCRSHRFDYASAEGYSTRQIRSGFKTSAGKRISINLALLAPGTLSITCYPKTPKWQGPVTWFLLPVKEGPKGNLPQHEYLAKAANKQASLLDWINAVRGDANLPTLRLASQNIAAVTKPVTSGSGIAHDRRLLKSLRTKLKSQGLKFIGENRAEGESLLDVAWLLWHSPRHRSLILNPKGRIFAASIIATRYKLSLNLVMIGVRHPNE